MSRAQHSLQVIGGATKTLAEWGVLSCVTTHRLGGVDEMSLVIDREISSASPFAPFSRLRLLGPDGQSRFIGRVLQPARAASSGEQTLSVTVAGPWSYLEADTYQQGAYFADDPTIAEPTVGIVPVGRVILNRNPVDGSKWKIAEQIGAALAYSVAQGAPIEYSTTRIPVVEAPEDQGLDMRVADVIRRSLGWAPHIGCRWDYAGLLPKLIFDDTIDPGVGGFTEREIDISDADGDNPLQGSARFDLLCPEFEIAYIYEAEVPGVRWNALHRDTSTAPVTSIAASAYGKQISTVVLRGMVWDGSSYSAPELRPDDGLAASMHKAYASLFYDLSWSQTGTEVDWQPAPGDLYSVTGTADFADARSVCQEITRDIQTGRTSFRCGPPVFLGLADRLALLIPNRIKGQPNAAGENTYGFKKPEPGDTEGMTKVRLAGAQQVDGGWSAGVFEVLAKTIPPES